MLLRIVLLVLCIGTSSAVPGIGNLQQVAGSFTRTAALTYNQGVLTLGDGTTITISDMHRTDDDIPIADSNVQRYGPAYTVIGSDGTSYVLGQFVDSSNTADQQLLDEMYYLFQKSHVLSRNERTMTGHAQRLLSGLVEQSKPILYVAIQKQRNSKSLTLNAHFDVNKWLDGGGDFSRDSFDTLRSTVNSILNGDSSSTTRSGIPFVVTLGTTPSTAGLAELTEAGLRRNRNRHRHRHHHQHRPHKQQPLHSRFNQAELVDQEFGVGRPPLAGGIGISVDGALDSEIFTGTLGGLLIARSATTATAGDYRLFGMTNMHVITTAGSVTPGAVHVCQPPNRANVCDELGTVLTACCQVPNPSDREHPTFHSSVLDTDMDVAAVEVTHPDLAVAPRGNVMCSVFSQIPASVTSPTTVVSVTGAAVATSGEAVWKYGQRTHRTTGTLSRIYFASAIGAPFDFRVDSNTWPAFSDVGRFPAGRVVPPRLPDGSSGGAPQYSPANEHEWFNHQKKRFTDWIQSRPIFAVLAQPRNFNENEANQIFARLWAAGYIEGVFSSKGDSGSWIMRDTSGVVLGLLAADTLEFDPFNCLPFMGRCWPRMRQVTLGYDIYHALAVVNVQHFRDVLNNGMTLLHLDICLESTRPKPPGFPTAGCCTAVTPTNTNGAFSCAFDRNCEVDTSASPVACQDRTDFGT